MIYLIGSAEKAGTAFTSFWGDAGAGWYDAVEGPVTFKVCSDSLFVRKKTDGNVVWTYENGVIINSTITVTDDKLYISLNPAMTKLNSLRPVELDRPELWQQQFLVALELKTGTKVSGKNRCRLFREPWRSIWPPGTTHSSSTHQRIRSTKYPPMLRPTENRGGRRLSVGSKTKGDHGKAIQRPAIVGGRVYVRPKVLDLKSGEILSLEMPSGKCGTYAATTKSLVFRTSNITMWNTESGSASSWDRMRPGCWLTTIPAAGMLLSPEGGGGCSCGSWMEMSVGFHAGRRTVNQRSGFPT